MALTWLITGCSSGFGLALARTVLAHGHNVLATSRNPSKSPEAKAEIEKHPHARWLALDVCSPAKDIEAVISQASTIFGQIDVLVNNAAYAVLGAAEDVSEAMAKREFDTNYWGVLRVIKAVLPQMRERQSGTIVNMSSIAGLTGIPGASAYAASKWAIEGFSESLSAELESFNIRVLVVVPGVFRTEFQTAGNMQYSPPSDPYKNTAVDSVLKAHAEMPGTQKGDPRKGTQRIFEAVTQAEGGKDMAGLLRLPLGDDSYQMAMAQFKKMQDNFEKLKDVAHSVAFDE